MSNLELAEKLKEETVENPLLEFEFDPGEEQDEARITMDADVYYNYHGSRLKGDDEIDLTDRYYIREETLAEHLDRQLILSEITEEKKRICRIVIDSLDESGYLKLSDDELQMICETDIEEIDEAVAFVQRMDPPGVAARNIKECLLIQMDAFGMPKDMRRLVEEHLEDIAANRMAVIAKSLGTSARAAQEIVDRIRSLDPKPGGRFIGSGRQTSFVVPDIVVHKTENGLTVSVNDAAEPKLRINEHYSSMLEHRTELMDAETAEYLKEKLDSSKQLIKVLGQRRATILRIANALVERQKAFFLDENGGISQLTMKEIAEEAGVHESTVSRAVSGKYLACDKGTFELASFFSSGLRSELNKGSSRSDIKTYIKEIIEGEPGGKPLSDKKISDRIMQEKGIDVSRRTIAKYREEMNIPSAPKRKRY